MYKVKNLNVKGDKVNKNYRFELGKNPARNFFILETDLKRIAVERNVPPKEVIQEFISDLENRDNPDYENKVNEININGIVSQNFISEAKKHFNRVIEGLEKAQRKDAKKEKNNAEKQEIENIWKSVKEFIESNKDLALAGVLVQIKEKNIFPELINGQRNTIIKRIEELIEAEAKKEELRKSKIEKTWKDICEIVEKGSNEAGVTKPQYWSAIRDKIVGQEEGEDVDIKLDESIQGDILELIDSKISDEKEQLYYNQVKYFTKDFSFLATYPEIQDAVEGKSGRKFTDKESFERFYELRTQVREGRDEYTQIAMLLKKGNIDETSRKILNGRIAVLKREREVKRTFENDEIR